MDRESGYVEGMNDIATAGNAVQGRHRVWVPIAVVGLLLVMIAAEAAFAKSQPAGEALVSGTVIGFGADRQASVQVGEGWVLDDAASDLDSQLVLTRGDVTVELSSVIFNGQTAPSQMWTGMGRLLDVERHAGAQVSLGSPGGFETSSGATGLEGGLQIGSRAGEAFVLPDAEGVQAVDAKVLAPADAGDTDWSAATQLIDSIAFEGES
ncbi:hypothetical protein [Glycomyces terrestris]|uniref:Uncharacterized protein n=1 Tax=Glycomyces terrestris TaxID=2493553 RepID=A0A426UVX5_9ACTN|nr:hypothetical protein [Glycomyces terrestris]RRR98462.1 hypothetical protein EIW28_16395 [Glycomyces terrestris]